MNRTMEDPRKELSTLLDDTSATHEEHEAAKKNNTICRMPGGVISTKALLRYLGFDYIHYDWRDFCSDCCYCINSWAVSLN